MKKDQIGFSRALSCVNLSVIYMNQIINQTRPNISNQNNIHYIIIRLLDIRPKADVLQYDKIKLIQECRGTNEWMFPCMVWSIQTVLYGSVTQFEHYFTSDNYLLWVLLSCECFKFSVELSIPFKQTNMEETVLDSLGRHFLVLISTSTEE